MLKKWVVLLIMIMTIYLAVTVSPLLAIENEGWQGNTIKTESRRTEIKYQQFFFYILGPEDVIKIDVWRHPEFSAEVTVGPDGTITLPLTGDHIRVSDLTRDEVANELIKVLSKYVKKPKVAVDIVICNSQVYYVFGNVGRQGKFPMKKSIVTLRDALVEAGMPNKTAALGSVHIITPDPERPTYKIINASRILYKGDLRYNVTLKSGDVVYVPNSFLNETNFILSQILGPVQSAKSVKDSTTGW